MGRLLPPILTLALIAALSGCRFDGSGLATTRDVGSDFVSVLDLRPIEISTADAPRADGPALDLPPPLDLTTGDAAPSCDQTLDSDTVMRHSFEKVTGFTFSDSAGSHHGTVTAKPTLIQGPKGCGQALAIPASGTIRVTVPDHAAFKLKEGSIDLWVRFAAAANSAAGCNGIISRDANGGVKPGHLTIFRSCDGSIAVRLQAGADYFMCRANAPVGQWFHVGVNFGKPTGLQLFVNGQQATGTHNITFGGPGYLCANSRTCGSSSFAGIDGNTNPWVIGASAMVSSEGGSTPASNPLAGAIDEVRVSKKARAF